MTRFVLLAWVLVAVSPLSVWAQTSSIGADEADTALKTPDGDPNLQGVWGYRTMTPLERPTELGEQQFFSAEEASAFQRQGLDERNKDQRASEVGVDQDVRNAYNEFWWDYGKTLTADLRTSLIVDAGLRWSRESRSVGAMCDPRLASPIRRIQQQLSDRPVCRACGDHQ